MQSDKEKSLQLASLNKMNDNLDENMLCKEEEGFDGSVANKKMIRCCDVDSESGRNKSFEVRRSTTQSKAL